MINKIIVVCTGNICRSPIAEKLLKTKLDERVQVDSAGIAALVGHFADPLAQMVMMNHGHDISNHRARQATHASLAPMDLILTLDQSHSDWIRLRFPYLQGRTHKLGRWRGNTDIADPYGMPKNEFDKAYAAIDACVDDWTARIKMLEQGN